jgi:hypothetical protein
MLQDGTYSAWFKTQLGEGTGIVHFADGRIWGGDSILVYDGFYEITGDLFTAIVKTRRHTAGHATVFGIDELELNIAGTMRGNIATCTGTTDAAPGMAMEATLVLCQSTPSIPETPRASAFDARRLPKLSQRSR